MTIKLTTLKVETCLNFEIGENTILLVPWWSYFLLLFLFGFELFPHRTHNGSTKHSSSCTFNMEVYKWRRKKEKSILESAIIQPKSSFDKRVPGDERQPAHHSLHKQLFTGSPTIAELRYFL